MLTTRFPLFAAGLACGATLAPLAAAFGAAAAPQPPAAEPAPTCLSCHGDPKLSTTRDGQAVSLFVEASELEKSVHGTLDCTDCHEGFNGALKPHKSPLTPANCLGCHDEAAKSHAFHPDFAATPLVSTIQTDCAGCHGDHGIQPVNGPASPFSGAKLAAVCGQCHDDEAKQYLDSAHGAALAAGRKEAPNCLSCHDRPILSRAKGDGLAVKLAQSQLCLTCHRDNPGVVARTAMGQNFVASYGQSVHGAALARGDAAAPSCVDCHGGHTTQGPATDTSKVNRAHIAETCSKCHAAAAKDYAVSVHATALRKGNLDSPVCTDCHGEHTILGQTDPNSPVSARNVSQKVCGACHASVKLNELYGLPTDRIQTFADSYHGLATRGGAVEAVNCTSCHGAHAIRNSSDPLSSINRARLAQTCGRCHPGANARFAAYPVHTEPTAASKDALIYWIATIYVWLIVLVVGGMAAHNVLDFLKKVRRKIAIQKGAIPEPVLPHRLYLRMTVNERLQHGTIVLSFAALAVTGFMLRYPDAWWVVSIRQFNSHLFEWRSLIHRTAGVVMIAAGAWHLGYLAFTKRGRRLFADLLPRFGDLTDAIGVLRHNLGLSPDKPKFGRFSYIEKSEYWALIWGTVIMGITGAFLWFENTAIELFTKRGYDVSRTIHFYEAVLATLAIIVWHLYFVIFNPDIYPMNLSWLTGRLSEKEMHEEHPLELEQIKAERADEADAALPPKNTP